MGPLTKKPPPKVHVEVIKKGPLVDPLSSSLFSTTDGGLKDKIKGTLCCSICLGYVIVSLTIVLKQTHQVSMIYSMTMIMMSCGSRADKRREQQG